MSLDARVKAHVLTGLENEPRRFPYIRAGIGADDDFYGHVAEPHLAAFGLGNGVVGVARHLERVLVLERGARARSDALADNRASALALLEPVAPHYAELPD